MYCAGLNGSGQLGRGTEDYDVNAVMQPIVGSAAEETMVSISSGETHTCALTDAYNVYCWGDDKYGQLDQGNGASLYVLSLYTESTLTLTCRSTPTLIPGLSDVSMVCCSFDTTFVLLKNNQGAKAFGYNSGFWFGKQYQQPLACHGVC